MPKGVYNRSAEFKQKLKNQIVAAQKLRTYKPRTEEERLSISIGTKKALVGKSAWNLGGTKKTDSRIAKYAKSNEGRIITLKQREQISKTLKANPALHLPRKPRSEETKQKIRDARARQKALPRRDTIPEVLVKNELEINKTKYIPQFPLYILFPSLFDKRSKVDYWLYQSNVFLFVDGDFIHANPFIYNPDHVIWRKKGIAAKQIWERDREITKLLEKNGGIVIRIWEKDILANTKLAIKNAFFNKFSQDINLAK
jgi:hypothetical protein